MPSMQYRPEIDGLRALAVMAVVIFHAFPHTLTGGFVGVDVFFVISGYLISGIIIAGLDDGSFRFLNFYARRVRRIFPALIVTMLASFAAGYWLLLPGELQQLGKHIAAGAGFVENIVLWREAGYFDAASGEKPLLHLWSLAVEEQYYLFYPVLLWATARRRWDRTALLTVLFAVSLALSVTLAPDHTVPTFFLLHTRMWELLGGALLAQSECATRGSAFQRRLPAKLEKYLFGASSGGIGEALFWSAVGLLGLIAILLAAVFLNADAPFPGWRAVFPVVGALLILLAGPRAWTSRALLSNRAMVGIGLISYPFYLWHWPVLTYARMATDSLTPADYGGLILLSLALAWATYRLIERPLRFGDNGVKKARALCVAMALTAVFGLGIYASDGLAFRLPALVRDVSFNAKVHEARWKDRERCLISLDKGDHVHPPGCLETDRRPLVLLWGDSTAGALYPGLFAFQQQHPAFGIGLLASTYCPPLLHYRPLQGYDCPAVNREVLGLVTQAKPEIVILSAQWRYGFHGDPKVRFDTNGMGETIAALRALGIHHIYIAGPVPFFNTGLPKTIATYYRRYHAQIPERSDFQLGDQVVEANMKQLAQRLGVGYLSLWEALCNPQGCLTQLPDDQGAPEVTVLDEVHMSPSGARYAAEQFMPSLLRQPDAHKK